MKEETLGKSVANLGEVNCVEGGQSNGGGCILGCYFS